MKKSKHLTRQESPEIITSGIVQVIDDFIRSRKSKKLSDRTIDFYTDELANHFLRYLTAQGIVSMGQIDAGLIDSYILYLEGVRGERTRGRKAGGLHAAYRSVRALCHWYAARDDEWHDPFSGRELSPPKISHDALPGVALGDIQRMIDACDTRNGLRDKCILLILFNAGLRASELIDLNVGHIDRINMDIYVEHGKGGKGRIVPFQDEKSQKTLRKYLKTRPSEGNAPLFCAETGGRLTLGGLRMIVQRLAQRAGLPKPPGLHDFRRAYGRFYMRNGGRLDALRRNLGHTDISTTVRYVYLDNDDVRDDAAIAAPAQSLWR
jgi:integrase/recombinase XerD